MPQKPMYPGVNNSIMTSLTAPVSATDTAFVVATGTVLPAPPNILTLGEDEDAELVLYKALNGNTISECERGFYGTTAKAWGTQTAVYRAYTTYDHDAVIDNIKDLDTEKLGATGDGSNVTVEFVPVAENEDIQSGWSLSAIVGRLQRWYRSFGTAAWKNVGRGADEVAPGDHKHVPSDVTGLDGRLDGAVNDANAAATQAKGYRDETGELVGRAEQDYTTLDARLNAAISELTVDSELKTIRTDAWGKTYDAAGDHVEALDLYTETKAEAQIRCTPPAREVDVLAARGSRLVVSADVDCTVWHRGGRNLFDNTASPITASGGKSEALPTGIRVSLTTAGTSPPYYVVHRVVGLGMGFTSCTFQFDIESHNPYDAYQLTISKNTSPGSSVITGSGVVTPLSNRHVQYTLNIPDAYNTDEYSIIMILWAGRGGASGVIGDYTDYRNLQVEIGSTATPYMPFAGSETLALTAAVPFTTQAYGEDHLIASDGNITVQYKPSAARMLTDTSVQVSDEGSIAQLDGLLGGTEIDVVAETVATQDWVPTPDSPVPIVGTELVTLSYFGANLFDQLATPYTSNASYSRQDGKARITATTTAGGYARFTLVHKMLKGKTISITPRWTNGAGGDGYADVHWINPSTGNGAGGTFLSIKTSGQTSTYDVGDPPIPDALLVVILRVRGATGITVPVGGYTEFDVMVSLNGSTEFEPYHSYTQSYAPPAPLYGWTGYADTWDLGRGVIWRVISRRKLNGVEAWVPNISAQYNLNEFFVDVPDALIGGATGILAKSDHYIGTTVGDRTTKDNIVYLNARGIGITDRRFSNVNDFKAWLAAHPIEVVYVLATPITETIPPQGTYAYDGTNIIYTTTGGTVKVTGRQGLPYAYDRLQDQITALQGQVTGG